MQVNTRIGMNGDERIGSIASQPRIFLGQHLCRGAGQTEPFGQQTGYGLGNLGFLQAVVAHRAGIVAHVAGDDAHGLAVEGAHGALAGDAHGIIPGPNHPGLAAAPGKPAGQRQQDQGEEQGSALKALDSRSAHLGQPGYYVKAKREPRLIRPWRLS